MTARKVDVTGIADKEEFIKLIIETEHLESTGKRGNLIALLHGPDLIYFAARSGSII